MTQIVELRKDPRPATTPEPQLPRARQFPSTHITAYILKFLGLKSVEPHPEKLYRP